MRTVLIVIILVISFSSCKDDANLGDSYYYLDPCEAIDVGYPDGAIIYKSDRKLVFDTTIISKQVVAVTHNDQFILAKQVSTADVYDTNYYFVDKTTDRVYGPLTLDSSKKITIHLRTGL